MDHLIPIFFKSLCFGSAAKTIGKKIYRKFMINRIFKQTGSVISKPTNETV